MALSERREPFVVPLGPAKSDVTRCLEMETHLFLFLVKDRRSDDINQLAYLFFLSAVDGLSIGSG
jgi:hypothetical protein